MEYDNIAAPGLNAVKHISKMIEGIVIAYRNEDVARTRTHGFGCQFRFQLEIELVHLDAGCAAVSTPAFRNREDDVEENGKRCARHRGDRFGEQVYDGDQKQYPRDQPQSHGNLYATESEIQRHLKFALARTGVAENQHREAVHREAPDHPESVKVRKKRDVSATDDDGDDLQRHDDIDDAMARAEPFVRLPEPGAEHAVFRNAVQYAVGADDGRVHRACQDQSAHNDNKAVEYQADDKWPFQIHRQSADQVFQELLAHTIRNDHHGKERNQGGKDQTVDKNNRAGLFQVGKLGAFDFAIDLRQRFLAAHREDGMTQCDEDGDDAEHVRKTAVRQPAEGAGAQPEVAWMGPRRQRGMAYRHGVYTPADEHHHHHGDQLHDLQSFFAGLGNALGVLPPEKKCDGDGKTRGNKTDCSGSERASHPKILQKFVDQSRKILARRDAADRARKDVI